MNSTLVGRGRHNREDPDRDDAVGGSGTYSLSSGSLVGLQLHRNSAPYNHVFAPASASVSGTTLTVHYPTPVGSGETVEFDITTGAVLTDTSSNTPTGQTNLTVTNRDRFISLRDTSSPSDESAAASKAHILIILENDPKSRRRSSAVAHKAAISALGAGRKFEKLCRILI